MEQCSEVVDNMLKMELIDSILLELKNNHKAEVEDSLEVRDMDSRKRLAELVIVLEDIPAMAVQQFIGCKLEEAKLHCCNLVLDILACQSYFIILKMVL